MVTVVPVVRHVETLSDQLVVTWDDGTISRFHHLWLRDNCPCPSCRHPSVPERLVDTLSIPTDVEPSVVDVTPDGALLITWAGDAHRSAFDAAWLAEHAYDRGPAEKTEVQTLWTAGTMTSPPEVAYDSIMSSDVDLLAWMKQLRSLGVTFIRRAPTVPGTVVGIAERVAFLRNSNFGLIWDVMSKPDPDSVAYTSHALGPHIDLVSREMLPGVQFLHCLVFEASGGDSILVDGFACAAELAVTDPESYELLTSTPLPFRYRDGGRTDLSARVPLIRHDPDGSLREVRYSNGLLAPLDVAPDRMLATYRALRAFGALLNSRRFEVRVRLQPGDVMCFDNYRILHGRSEFDPNSGPRHLQGCYIDRDDFLSRIRTLENAVARGFSPGKAPVAGVGPREKGASRA
jgi:gamma-butyrobetaine dioxygenase